MKTQTGMRHFGTFRVNPLSAMERACARVLLSHGHRLSIFTYAPSFDAPEGVEIRDARDILERRHESRFFTDGAPDLRSFADFFRYEMMLKEGLSWIEADVLMLGALSVPDDADLLVLGLQGDVNPAMLSLRDREVVADLCHSVRRMGDRPLRTGSTGALVLGRIALEYRARVDLAPAGMLETATVRDLAALVLPDNASDCAVRYGACAAIQIGRDVLDELGLGTDLAPPAGSFLHDVLAQSEALSEFGAVCSAATLKLRIEMWRARQGMGEQGMRGFVRRAFPALVRGWAHHPDMPAAV